jgi:hypothetical protein
VEAPRPLFQQRWQREVEVGVVVLGGDDRLQILPDSLLRRIAEYALGGGVPEGYFTIRGHHENRIARGIRDRTKSRLTLAERVFRALDRGDVFLDREEVGDIVRAVSDWRD